MMRCSRWSVCLPDKCVGLPVLTFSGTMLLPLLVSRLTPVSELCTFSHSRAGANFLNNKNIMCKMTDLPSRHLSTPPPPPCRTQIKMEKDKFSGFEIAANRRLFNFCDVGIHQILPCSTSSSTITTSSSYRWMTTYRRQVCKV